MWPGRALFDQNSQRLSAPAWLPDRWWSFKAKVGGEIEYSPSCLNLDSNMTSQKSSPPDRPSSTLKIYVYTDMLYSAAELGGCSSLPPQGTSTNFNHESKGVGEKWGKRRKRDGKEEEEEDEPPTPSSNSRFATGCTYWRRPFFIPFRTRAFFLNLKLLFTKSPN